MLKFGGWPRLTWGHKLMTGSTARFLSFAARCRRNHAGSLEEFSPKTTGTTFCSRSRRPTPVVPRDCRLLPALQPTVPEGTRGQFPRSAPTNRRGMEEQRRRCHDTQAGVPSATRPRAQLAFKDSMVHEILQFTPSIAFHYVLHRCKSRDIHCRESFD